MKTIKIITLLMFTLLNNSSCESFYPEDDLLYLSRRDYSGNQLRIDGYYYRVNYEEKIFDGYFFYRNGIVISLGGVRDSLIKYDKYIETEVLNGSMSSRIKSSYGVFNIDEDNILFERWYPGTPFKTYVRTGKILNDTTFHITESYRMVEGAKTEIKERDEMYYFRAFSPKPDSTNVFVK